MRQDRKFPLLWHRNKRRKKQLQEQHKKKEKREGKERRERERLRRGCRILQFNPLALTGFLSKGFSFAKMMRKRS